MSMPTDLFKSKQVSSGDILTELLFNFRTTLLRHLGRETFKDSKLSIGSNVNCLLMTNMLRNELPELN